MHNTRNVSESVVKAALAAVEAHPLHAEATNWKHCVSDVFAQPKSFIDRGRFSDEQRISLHKALEDISTVLLVGYWTADKEPEPMSGFGKLYAFLLHPETFVILGTDVGTWRS